MDPLLPGILSLTGVALIPSDAQSADGGESEAAFVSALTDVAVASTPAPLKDATASPAESLTGEQPADEQSAPLIRVVDEPLTSKAAVHAAVDAARKIEATLARWTGLSADLSGVDSELNETEPLMPVHPEPQDRPEPAQAARPVTAIDETTDPEQIPATSAGMMQHPTATMVQPLPVDQSQNPLPVSPKFLDAEGPDTEQYDNESDAGVPDVFRKNDPLPSGSSFAFIASSDENVVLKQRPDVPNDPVRSQMAAVGSDIPRVVSAHDQPALITSAVPLPPPSIGILEIRPISSPVHDRSRIRRDGNAQDTNKIDGISAPPEDTTARGHSAIPHFSAAPKVFMRMPQTVTSDDAGQHDVAAAIDPLLPPDIRIDAILQRDPTVVVARGEMPANGYSLHRHFDLHAPAIARQVAEVAVKLGQGEVELSLAPEELGKMRLRVARGEHHPVVTVWFESPDILETARRHLDQLLQDLHDSGLENASLDLRGQSDNRHPNDHMPDVSSHDRMTGGDDMSLTTAPADPTRRLSDRLLDIRV